MSWVDDMNKAMDEHPEEFGMVLDDHGNPVEAPTADVREPRTEAGRAHHDGLHFHDGLYICAPNYELCGIRRRILAIEDEARGLVPEPTADVREVVERAVRAGMTDKPSSYLEHGDTADHIANVVVSALHARGLVLANADEGRVECVCGRSVLSENWPNHLLSARGRHAASGTDQ